MVLLEKLWEQNDKVIHTGTISSFKKALRKAGVPSLIIYPETKDVYYQQRIVDGGEIFFLVNNSEDNIEGEFKFLTKGRAELWNPCNAEITELNVSYSDNYSGVRLTLPAKNGRFVLFYTD